MPARRPMSHGPIPSPTVVSLAVLLLLPVGAALAGPGALDPTFGAGGLVTTDLTGIPTTANGAHAILVQPDGKLVAVGEQLYEGFKALRYETDGTLDASFGSSGVATADVRPGGTKFVQAAVLQPDGKIVAAGYAYAPGPHVYALARFTTDGALDASFGSGGIVTTSIAGEGLIYALALQPDGKLVVAGSPLYTVARYLPDGTLDASFGTAGIAMTDFPSCCEEARAIALQADGKIVVAGFAAPFGTDDFGLARFDTDGTLDPSFGVGGQVVVDLGSHDTPFALAVQPDGKIVAAGRSGRGFAVTRLDVDGSLDAGFGSGGMVRTALNGDPGPYWNAALAAMALQFDGKIVGVGEASTGFSPRKLAVVRYLADGTLDTGFGFDGMVLAGSPEVGQRGSAVVLQPDGKIAVAGSGGGPGGNGFSLARFVGGDLPGCAPAPRDGCRGPAKTGSAALRIRNAAHDQRDRVAWRLHAEATALDDFGDPTDTDDYTLCIYDESAGGPTLIFEAAAPGGVDCSLKSRCWNAGGSRIRYRDPERLPAGLDSLLLREGADAKARIVALGRGPRLTGAPLGLPPLPLPLPARVQVQGSHGPCWEASYSASGVRRNDAEQFNGASN
jgi:uncharacterized delta-60 repeat protein